MLYAFKLGRKLRGEEPYCPEKGGKGGSSDKSAKYAAEAQKYAADLQNQQWQTIMKNLAPFTPLLPLLMPTNHQVFRQQLVAERLVRLPVQVLPAFWEHQHLGALALVLVSDCLARCFKG